MGAEGQAVQQGRGLLTRRILAVAALWTLSDIGFYTLLPALGLTLSYNQNAMAIALYYFYWIGLSFIWLWPVLSTWPRHARWATFQNTWASAALWTLFFLLAIGFAAYVMPELPAFDAQGRENPPDMPQADPWYFLPKSVDIFFQQLLVGALVLSLAEAGLRLRRMAWICAALFGASHLLLLLGGVPVGYVLRFTLMATVFGFVFPWLILRVRNGFAFSYMAHWSFYAGAVIIARLASA